MAFRVVLYVEGAGEWRSGDEDVQEMYFEIKPRDELFDALLGPGHLLVKRSIAHVSDLREGSITFIEPLRLRGGARAEGSALLSERNVRRLLTWPVEDGRPDLAIIFVDKDEQTGRRRMLEGWVEGGPLLPCIIGVAIQEFEAWLLGDHKAVCDVMGRDIEQTRDPESMRRREAKELLAQWCEESKRPLAALRCDLANTCDLDAVSTRCPSFGSFLSDLRQKLRSLQEAGD